MKFVALNSYFLWPYATGGERAVLEILSALEESGHEVLIRYAIPPGLPDYAFESFRMTIQRFRLSIGQCSRRRVAYHAGKVPVEAVGVSGPPPTWIGDWLEELVPDVVFVQAKDLLLVPALTAFWRGIGFVFLQEEGALHSLASSLTPEGISRIASSSFSIVTPSRFLQHLAEEAGLRSTLFYPALTLLPHAPRPTADAPITSFASSADKGVDIVIALAQCMGDHSFRVVAGWNEAPHEVHTPNLEFISFALHPSELYGQSSIVLVPSRCREGFGRIAHETMAVGRVPVVSDRGALPEVTGEDGVILPIPEKEADVHLWEDAIRELLRDDQLAGRSPRCRSRAEALTEASRKQFEALFGCPGPKSPSRGR